MIAVAFVPISSLCIVALIRAFRLRWLVLYLPNHDIDDNCNPAPMQMIITDCYCLTQKCTTYKKNHDNCRQITFTRAAMRRCMLAGDEEVGLPFTTIFVCCSPSSSISTSPDRHTMVLVNCSGVFKKVPGREILVTEERMASRTAHSNMEQAWCVTGMLRGESGSCRTEKSGVAQNAEEDRAKCSG